MRLLLLALETGAYTESSPVTTDDAVASVSLGLVSTQVPLISCSTHSVKLPFFQKALAVVVIVKFARSYSRLRETEGGGAYAQDELNIRASAPSPLLSKSGVQKGGAYFRELTVNSDHFQILRSYNLLLKLPVLMCSWICL